MSKPFELCIIRLSAIGDVCHALATVNAIQKHMPNINISWVIGKVEYDLVKHIQNVEFIVYDKKDDKKSRKEVKQAFRGKVFDALFVMQVSLRANLVSRMIKAKRRIGFDYKRSREGHFLFINERIDANPQAHVLEGFMGFAEKLGVVASDDPSWDIPLLPQDIEYVETTLSSPYVVISPAASSEERNWPPTRYAEIIDYLAELNFKVVLCGGPGAIDSTLASEILKHTSNVYLNLVGKTSLICLLAVISRAKFVIAPDTGPAHMATTQGVPVIGLYAHSNPLRTGPYNSLHLVASVYDECIKEQYKKAWQSLPWGTRAKGGELMEKITVEEVKSLIQRVLVELSLVSKSDE